jgi:ABC-2 type transport system permease protein
MMRLALSFELRSLVRSRAAQLAVLGFLGVGLLAVLLGRRHVTQWHDEVAAAHADQARTVAEARGHLTAGDKGPADKPWVDLTQASWQDRYAATRFVRQPSALAGIAAGAVDPAPAAFQIDRGARALSARGNRIDNPELAAGAVDLVFVLTLLLPLLVGVLGLGIGPRERESGLDRLVVVQAGDLRTWMVARTLAVTGVAAAAASLVCLGASLAGGAPLGDLLALVGVAAAIATLWGGLLLAVNARAEEVRTAAVGFGLVWATLCLLVPGFASDLAFAEVERDFALAESLTARTEHWALWEADLTTLTAGVQARHPGVHLDAEAAATHERVVRGAAESALFAERHARRLDADRAAVSLTERAAWASPTLAGSLVLERLVGAGPEAASAYRAALDLAIADRVGWVLETSLAGEALDGEDFEALVADVPPVFRTPDADTAGPLWVLLAWVLGAWALALARLRDVGAPSP